MSPRAKPQYGSLLMRSEGLPVDRHGCPYQVILVLRPGGGGTEDLRRDRLGRVLAWVHDPGGETVTGLDGQAMTQPVPAAVQSAAEAWLAHQRDPDFEPAPGWRPGDRTMLG